MVQVLGAAGTSTSFSIAIRRWDSRGGIHSRFRACYRREIGFASQKPCQSSGKCSREIHLPITPKAGPISFETGDSLLPPGGESEVPSHES